jgi:tRNA U34 5-methylaminomethyl-2-thiouridine-forming methyltransferase MnmC
VSAGNIILITSQDGTNTLFNTDIGEHYHSVYGAFTESQHVFIANGLKVINKKDIKILEIGFGTGLNAFLSLLEGHKSQKFITYESVELYPVNENIFNRLNYADLIAPEFSNLFQNLHYCEWDKHVAITDYFNLKKISGDATQIDFGNNFDLVFFDAFSPDKQPGLWSSFIFEKIFNSMNIGGILTTYCSKGIVKQALKGAGFRIERLPGAPGKRHMLRAVKR